MTMRLDIVTNDAGELVRREHARDLGAGVVIALYRLFKLAGMHDLTNQALVRQLEEAHHLICDYGLRAGTAVNILFARRAVFVAGQLLKGNRGTYDAATELGDMLERFGGAELTIQRDLTQDDLRAFTVAVSQAMRSEKGRFRSPTPKIALRAVNDAARLRGLELEELGEEQRVVRTYASAVVIMRRFFEDLSQGRYLLPRRVKRVAQTLVDLSAGGTPAFLGVTEARNANHDDAGRAVNTAILSVAMAREMTDDRATLAQVAMAAMMLDVARPRAVALEASAGPRISGVAPKLSEDAEDKLAAGTAAVLTALGRVNEATVTRTVISFEALWMRRQRFLGPVYNGVRAPTLQARIVMIARRYNDLLTPEPGLAAQVPDFAIATLAEELKDPADRTVLRMLVAALGLYPVGTIVQLSTGEVGEVIGGGDRKSAPDRPRLRLVMDARGGVLSQGEIVDLAQVQGRAVAKVLSVDGWKKGLGAPPASELPPPPPPAAPVPDDMLPEPLEEPVEERQSWPSEDIGTSPSAVADALGKLMSSAPPPAVADHDKTIAQPAIFENNDAARGRIAFSIPPRGADNKDAFRDLPPTAKGTLTATPLVHVLVYMFDHALSGTVVFRDPEGGESVVYFLEGAPAKVKTHRAIALLGDELVAAGAVTREVVSKAIDSAKRLGVLLGEYLRGNSLVSADALARALEVQVRKKVASLVNLSPDTGYCFYRDVNALDSWAGEQLTPCHPLDAVLACARDWYDRARIHATLNRLGKQALVLHGDVDLSPLALTDEEEQVLAVMRAEGPPLQNLYQRRFADEETISSLVYMLAVTRQFSFAKAPPMRWTGRPRVSRPAERAALPLSAIVEPRPPSIPPRGEAKLGKSAGTWRPPRPADDDGGIDVEVSVESSHPPPRSDDTAERALQAMTDFRLAETAMQRNDLQMAERLARRALDQDPHQAEYRAAVEWLRAMNAPASLGEAIEALGNMLEKDPTHERTLLYRARLLKKAGRVRDALRDFEAILAQNPRHSEAASESRHLKTRR